MLRWTRIDTALACAALLGILALVFVLPTQHPDAAADFSLGESGAEQAARTALSNLGYEVGGWTFTAQPSREDDLLDSLQHAIGRSAAIAALGDGETGDRLPAYFWRVDGDPPDVEDDEQSTVVFGKNSTDTEGFGSFTVDVTASGRMWGLRVREKDNDAAASLMDAGALRTALEDTLTDEAFEQLRLSLSRATFTFDKASFAPGASPQTGKVQSSVLDFMRTAADSISVSVSFDRSTAEQMAAYHTARLDLFGDGRVFSPDSVSLEDGNARFHYDVDVDGLAAHVDLDVAPAGVMSYLDVDFSPGRGERTDMWLLIYGIASGVAYVLLGLTLLVYLVRRLSARLVDFKTALIDGAIVALFSAGVVTMATFLGDNDNNPPLLALFGIILPMIFLFFMFGFTLLAGSVEGLAREAWGDKMRASSLVRRGNVLNERVGFALLRGTVAGVALAGLSAVLLLVVPLPLRMKEDLGLLLGSAIPARGVVPFLLAGMTSYLVTVPSLLGLGAFLRRRGTSTAVLVGATSVTLALLGSLTYLVSPAPLTFLTTLPLSIGLVLLMVRYDFLTAFLGCFFAIVAWAAGHGLLMGGTASTVDALIIALVTLGALILGWVGVRSRQTGDEETDYVPAYVTEMAQQARMKQELEFARQVQMSFLPRRMPDVPGVDAAALCIAASEVGGDYYDFVDLGNGRLAVAIGDVSGKGIQAAFYMTLVKGFLRSLVRQFDSPADVLRHLNALFCENAPRGTFISMIFGILDVNAGTFTFARAGHNPLILQRVKPGEGASAQPIFAQPRGLGIGMVKGARFDTRIEEQTLDLTTGDTVVLYTDGFSEAMNPARVLYGDDRLALSVHELGERTAAEIVSGLATGVQHFAGSAPQHDDMTIVVLKLQPSVRIGERTVAEAV